MAEIKDIPNSQAYRDAQAKKEAEKGPKVQAKIKEKTFKQKCKEAIFAEDVGDIKEYAVLKVIIPNIKKLGRMLWVSMFDLKFFGKEMKGSGASHPGGGSVVDYSKRSTQWADDDDLERKYETKSASTSVTGATLRLEELSNVQFTSEDEALNVLRYLKGNVVEYGVACVSDFLEKSGLRANNTHKKWGWYDLDIARVEFDEDTEMWYIVFPKPKIV